MTTSVFTSVSVTSRTFTDTRPSSMRMLSPSETSWGRPLNVVETRSLVPGTSSVVMVRMSPSASSCWSSMNRPSRIFGPCRSTRIATAFPDSSAALRTRWKTFVWVSSSPWLRLIRATFIPASMSARICSEDSVRSEEHTSELQLRGHLVCRLLLEKKNDHVVEADAAAVVETDVDGVRVNKEVVHVAEEFVIGPDEKHAQAMRLHIHCVGRHATRSH